MPHGIPGTDPGPLPVPDPPTTCEEPANEPEPIEDEGDEDE
jgi:hypothetical protein